LGSGFSLVDDDTGEVIAEDVEMADNFWRRFRGLMLRWNFRVGQAMLFKFNSPGRHSIHMFFVRFPIDLVYLDSDSRVVETRAGVKPWHMHVSRVASKSLIELPVGTIARLGMQNGHKISTRGLRIPNKGF
jgi:uncharacterized membrane protein (UPF0127 family)